MVLENKHDTGLLVDQKRCVVKRPLMGRRYEIKRCTKKRTSILKRAKFHPFEIDVR